MQKSTIPQKSDRDVNAELQTRFRSEAIMFEDGALTSVGVTAFAGSLAELLSKISAGDRQRVLRTYAATTEHVPGSRSQPVPPSLMEQRPASTTYAAVVGRNTLRSQPSKKVGSTSQRGNPERKPKSPKGAEKPSKKPLKVSPYANPRIPLMQRELNAVRAQIRVERNRNGGNKLPEDHELVSKGRHLDKELRLLRNAETTVRAEQKSKADAASLAAKARRTGQDLQGKEENQRRDEDQGGSGAAMCIN